MQIYLNTYGTYLHVKDDMFEIKIYLDKYLDMLDNIEDKEYKMGLS